MSTILPLIIVGIVSAIVALWSYILIRKILLKGQKESIIKQAEIDAESIKKEKIYQAKEKFLQLKSEHEQYINEKNKQISDIENRLKQKENSLNQQFDALNSLLDGKTISSCEKNSDGSYDVTLSNGTKFTVLADGTDYSSLVSVKVVNGVKYWATYDADGNLVVINDAEGNPVPVVRRTKVKVVVEDGFYYLEIDGQKYIFIDTAGMRRKSKIKEEIERFSIIRAVAAVERCDVAILVIDANEGITDQDTKIAGIAHERGKAAIIAVNKWDSIEKDEKTTNKYLKDIGMELKYMDYAPCCFISALTGQRITRMLEMIDTLHHTHALRISTGVLNDVLNDAVLRVQPPTDKGKRLKIFYMTQASTRPPTFVCFVNSAELFHYSYQRYIENQIREVYGLEGTPVRFVIRERDEKSKH